MEPSPQQATNVGPVPFSFKFPPHQGVPTSHVGPLNLTELKFKIQSLSHGNHTVQHRERTSPSWHQVLWYRTGGWGSAQFGSSQKEGTF